MINLERVYDIDYNPKLNCFEFYVIEEKIARFYSIMAYPLARLYRKKNGESTLTVLNGIRDKILEEEVCSFVILDDEEAIEFSKKHLNLFLV